MKREQCPCCGYPTLKRRSHDEICILCDWEDEDFSEQHPQKITGGPNGDYSLEEARRNFGIHFTMYRKKPKAFTSAYIVKQKKLIDAYKSLDEKNNEAKWEKIMELEQELRLYS